MNELVFLKKDEALTDSLIVAEMLETVKNWLSVA